MNLLGGKKATIPGKIEVENFDIPGSGKGNNTYKDNDSENNGKSTYREGLGVDLYDEGSGVVLGMTQAGEWLEYSVDVIADGEYDAVASVASGSETSSFRMLLDGEEMIPETIVPKTGEDWSVYKDLSLGKVKLTKGEHIIRLEIVSDYVNIDWFRIGEETNTTKDNPLFVSTNLKLPLALETFSIYDVSGNFVAKFNAANVREIHQNVTNLVKKHGIYFVKSCKGSNIYKISIVK